MAAIRKVSVIPADYEEESVQYVKPKKLKVAAYCRVSTDHEEQQNSYEAQKNHYTNFIKQNPEWTFAKIYADEGITGTNTRNRTEFNNMIRDSMDGKIDLIITKSISRFARNTLDCLKFIRQLKEVNIPVIFEKENINTMDSTGEFVLTLLGSLAQEESRSISTNIKWAVEKQFQRGEMRISRIYGYDVVDKNKLVINPETSKNVKKIFKLYLDGNSLKKIGQHMMEKGIKSPGGKENWSATSVLFILQNEKYTGDAILQKYYCPDFLTGKALKNKGEVKKYFVEGSHEKIITKEVFNLTQEEIKRRGYIPKASIKSKESTTGKYSSKYSLSEILECGECGKPYRRQKWNNCSPPRIVWRCLNRLETGKKNCKHSPTLDEDKIEKAVLKSINELISEKEMLINTLNNNVRTVIKKKNKAEVKSENKNESEIQRVKYELFKTMEDEANGEMTDEIAKRYEELTAKLKELQSKKDNEIFNKQELEMSDKKYVELEKALGNLTTDIVDFDNVLVRDLIEKIVVMGKEKVLVRFKGGFEKAVWIEG